MPSLVTQAHICPANSSRVVALGPKGIYFVNYQKSFEMLEGTLVTGAIPSQSLLASAHIGDGDESQQEATRQVLESVAAAVQRDSSTAGLSGPAGNAAVAAVADKRGSNTWLSAVWISETSVAAVNAAGDICIYDATIGSILKRVSVQAVGAGASVTAMALAASTLHLLVGCSDGYVRYLSLAANAPRPASAFSPGAASPASSSAAGATVGPSLALVACFRLTPGSAAGPGGAAAALPAAATTTVVVPSASTPASVAISLSAAASTSGAGSSAPAAVVVVTSIAIVPSTTKAYVTTSAGTVHCLPMGPSAELRAPAPLLSPHQRRRSISEMNAGATASTFDLHSLMQRQSSMGSMPTIHAGGAASVAASATTAAKEPAPGTIVVNGITFQAPSGNPLDQTSPALFELLPSSSSTASRTIAALPLPCIAVNNNHSIGGAAVEHAPAGHTPYTITASSDGVLRVWAPRPSTAFQTDLNGDGGGSGTAPVLLCKSRLSSMVAPLRIPAASATSDRRQLPQMHIGHGADAAVAQSRDSYGSDIIRVSAGSAGGNGDSTHTDDDGDGTAEGDDEGSGSGGWKDAAVQQHQQQHGADSGVIALSVDDVGDRIAESKESKDGDADISNAIDGDGVTAVQQQQRHITPATLLSRNSRNLSPLQIVTIAVHPSLPLVAIGASDGSVSLLLVSEAAAAVPASGKAVAGVVLQPLYRDATHAGPVTSLLFSSNTNGGSCLVSVCASESRLVVHEIGAAIVGIAQSMSDVDGAAAAAIAYCRLPVVPGYEVTSLAWIPGSSSSASSTEEVLLLGTASGHLLSLSIPSSSPSASAEGVNVADLTPSLSLRGRLSSGIVSMVVTHPPPSSHISHSNSHGHHGGGSNHGSSGAGAPVLFASLAGEKSLAVIPIDATHLVPSQLPPSALESADEFEAIAAPGSTHAVFSLNAHKMAGHCLTLSPSACTSNGALIASGGTDGAVTLLSVAVTPSSSAAAAGGCSNSAASTYKIAVSASFYTSLHGTSPVTSLAFSSTGTSLLSSSHADGSVSMLSVEADGAAASSAAAAAAVLTEAHAQVLSSAVAAVADAASAPIAAASLASTTSAASELTLAARIAAADEAAARAQHSSVHASLLTEVSNFKHSLASLLAANASAPEIERLERHEFVIDAAGHDAVIQEYEARAAERRGAYTAECAALDADIGRVTAECVDTAEELPCEVRALATDGVVRNFAIGKRTAQEKIVMDRIALLRGVELAAMGSVERDTAANNSSGSGSGGSSSSWYGLTTRIPADCDWIYHAGLLLPTLDPAKQHSDVAARSAAGAGAAASSSSSPAKSPAAGGANAPSDGGSGGSGGGGDGGAEVQHKDGAGGGAGEDGAGGAAAGGVPWEDEAVVSLMYHPAAVRTPAQKRTQVALVSELIRATSARFNASFNKLRSEKLETIEGIKSRHARMRDILVELGTPVVHMTDADSKAAAQAAATNGSIPAVVTYAAGMSVHGRPLTPPASSISSPAASPGGGDGGGDASGSSSASATGSIGSGAVAAGRTPIGPVASTTDGNSGSSSGSCGAVVVMTITDPLLSAAEDPQAAIRAPAPPPAPASSSSSSDGAGNAISSSEIGVGPYVSPAEAKRRAEEAGGYPASVAFAVVDDVVWLAGVVCTGAPIAPVVHLHWRRAIAMNGEHHDTPPLRLTSSPRPPTPSIYYTYPCPCRAPPPRSCSQQG